MLYLIYAVHVLICLFLIMVVLLQQGSGADLSVFGGGGTQTAFGARSATSLLHKLTVGGFIGFILTTIAIGFLKSGDSAGSVMSGVDQPAIEVPVEAEDAAVENVAAPAEDALDAAAEAVNNASGEGSAGTEEQSAPADDESGDDAPDGP